MRISIRHYLFDIREPFQQMYNADVGMVLNRLRAAAIREIWTKRIPKDRILEVEELEALRTKVQEFDASYLLPAPIPLKNSYTLDDEIATLREDGWPDGPDLQAVARRRLAARLGLRPIPALEDLV